MTDNFGTSDSPNPNNCSETPDDYLERAASACEAGDLVLGMHLYLAAYEKAVADPDIPDGMALAGLHEAWSLACDLKERSMAEYVFEKLEPFLTADEIPEYANELQNLALDRLEEYGFSREELQDMAEIISGDLMGDGSVVKVEQFSIPRMDDSADLADLEVDEADATTSEMHAEQDDGAHAQLPPEGASARPNQIDMGVADVNDFNPYDDFNTSSVGTSYHAATNDGAGSYIFTRDKERAAESERARAEAERGSAEEPALPSESTREAGEADDASRVEAGEQATGADAPASAEVDAPADDAPTADVPGEASSGQVQQAKDALAERDAPAVLGAPDKADAKAPSMPSMPDVPQVGKSMFSYRNLVGYDEVIPVMRELGIGMQRDPGFQNFVKMMNARHGLTSMPSLDTMLFRAPAVEDAARFLDATIGEIGLPVLRMSMEENVQGMPMLCVSVQGSSRPRMNHAHNRFEGPGILVIEDLDMWAMPAAPEGMDGIGGFMMANISRGAREAVGLIRSAVEDPNVYVLATSSTEGHADPFFYDLLEPMTIIEIGNPNEADRNAIWRELMSDHSSLRLLDRSVLVRLSAGLARVDMYLAAREAVEEAYKKGLAQRMYIPVSLQNILDKLAACQPIDSEAYHAIEEEAVKSFRDDLGHLEDLLDDSRK